MDGFDTGKNTLEGGRQSGTEEEYDYKDTDGAQRSTQATGQK